MKTGWMKTEQGKRVPAAEILERILLPPAAYLWAGAVVLNIGGASVPYAYFAVWAVMAGILAGIKEIFPAKQVMAGTGIYAAVLMLWFLLSGEEDGRLHAVLLAAALAGIFLMQALFRLKAVRALYGYAALAVLIGFEMADIGFAKGIIALAFVLF